MATKLIASNSNYFLSGWQTTTSPFGVRTSRSAFGVWSANGEHQTPSGERGRNYALLPRFDTTKTPFRRFNLDSSHFCVDLSHGNDNL